MMSNPGNSSHLNSAQKSYQSETYMRNAASFAGKLSINYVFDSFYNGSLFEINEEIMHRYGL